ncbi:type IV pilus twitching motility protein PilT [Gemmatimonas phototrophica]|uniref:type IV pilus twitching motility protein PilT n=1 Tax=Gemmatimonas phototrophica TaxID=1379270 RepID=UPI000AF064DE|nr:type IV pilus twitching motility protein PilT [Gemmatimonas phototrophica]
MPQLDKVLPRLESGAATQILLETNAPIRCMTPNGLQQVSTQVLSQSQVLALVGELAGPEDRAAIVAAEGIKFTYTWNEKQWLVQQEPDASTTRIHIRPWVERESTGEPSTDQSTVRKREGDAPFGPFHSNDAAKAALEKLLRIQCSRGAADLHLRVGEPPIFRMGGDLLRLEDEAALDDQTVTAMMRSIMPDKNKKEFDTQWDTDFAHEIEGVSRFRVNVLRDRHGVASVIRTIASNTVTVEQMGISPEVQALCHLTKGLVLVTGPTGSGKSTTLCALVDLVNRTRSDHIITIEDPIEFVHQSKKCLITQRQVGVHTQSFKSALRAALREDPDIILVGELRDLETIAIALETAETGHLVFGTLHTSTAASTINRIVDQFPADRQDQIRIMLAESLKGVISQTLCKKIGGGRVAAREILLVNKAVSALIREGKTVQIPNIIQTQKKLGMETLNDALLNLVKSKTIEAEEAYVKAVEKKEMSAKLRALGHNIDNVAGEE